MERRNAPSSYARKTLVAFEVAGAIGSVIGIASAGLIHFFWHDAPIWAFSLAFGLGFVIFIASFVRLRPKFTCPQCGKELGRDDMRGKEDGEPIRFVCTTCQIEWESGMNVPG